MLSLLCLWAQVALIEEWGEAGSTWKLHGAELRKTSAYASPRAFSLLLNGADRYGLPYQTDNPRLEGWGDSAVSACLSLSPTSLYFVSFAYQRGGLMDPPEPEDTLALWGLTDQGVWELLWQTTGELSADTAFTPVLIPLTGSQWFHPCFRLKWTVWGSTYGLYDNWLIAYTYVSPDTSRPRPVWTHLPRIYDTQYGIRPPAYLAVDSLVGVFAAERGLFVSAEAESEGQLLGSWIGNTSGVSDSLRIASPQKATAGTFPVAWHLLSPTGGPPLTLVDSFSLAEGTWGYDDGEMEAGYGLRQPNRPFTQEFFLDTPQIIRRVGIRFFPVPTQYGKPFQLGIWKPESGTTPLYTKFERFRVDSTGGFTWYEIDTPLVLQGKVYVGFIQADGQPLGVGWDASYSAPNRVWIESGGSWVPSQLTGCLMVRIETGPGLLSLSSPESRPLWWLSPSPASPGHALWVEGVVQWPIRVRDMTGRTVSQWSAGEPLVAPSVPGLYWCLDASGQGYRLLVIP